VPALYLSDGILLGAVTFLFLRRVFSPQLRYASLIADYFPLFLIGFIALTGMVMRYVTKIDVEAVKQLTMGLVTFHPVLPPTVTPIFFIHLFLVSVLLMYFPFSKLMHAPGVFLSPPGTCPTTPARCATSTLGTRPWRALIS
jgi:nitrate reductase gamma subunit